MKNPAVYMYELWRGIIRWHAEHEVEYYRKEAQEWVDMRIHGGTSWNYLQENGEVENHTLRTMWNGYDRAHAPLDYRMSLRVVGITDRHIYETPTIGPDMSVFEPVIRLQITHTGWYRSHRGHVVAIMDLYPNGDFILHALPSQYHQIYPRWTFFKTTWIASKRQWLVPPAEGSDLLSGRTYQPGWVSFDEKDWHHPLPYLPNHSFKSGAHYMLEEDIHGFWRVTTQRNSPVGEYEFKIDGESADLLRQGYARSQRRYKRFERSSELAVEQRKRDKIAIYVPKHGRVTGADAVDRFTESMRVYEPAEAVKEAVEDGSDRLVTSPVHQ